MIELLQKCTAQGFKVFACNLDKTPATNNGFYDATDDEVLLKRQFYKEDLCVGFPTGQINKIAVIDIDVGKDGDIRSRDEILEELREQYGPIPDTFSVVTPSGGLHLYYKLQPEDKLPSVRRFFHPSLSVDIRGEGGYVIFADFDRYMPLDQDDITDLHERCAEIPRHIVEFRKKQTVPEQTSEQSSIILPEQEIREIRSALAVLDADDRDLWVQVGLALKATGAGNLAKGLWIEWAMKSDKYNAADDDKRWKTFKPTGDINLGSIFHKAKQIGWVSTYVTDTPVKAETVIISDVESHSKKIAKQYEKKKFPLDLLSPPGYVGALADYISSQAVKDQPILNVAAALAFAGTIMGRKFQTESGVRTNIYIIGIGESGCGKENARNCIKRIVAQCPTPGMEAICSVEALASDTAIYNALYQTPSQLFLLDEVGRMLQTTGSAKSNPYMFGIPTVLLTAYSASDSFMAGKSYADVKKNIRINNPNLCIYATTTHDQFYDSLTKDNLSDGLISRLLTFESECARPPTNRVRRFAPPADLLKDTNSLYNRPVNICPEGNLSNTTSSSIVNPRVVPMSSDALSMIEGFNDHIENLRGALEKQNRIESIYNRARLTAEKIALILAVGDAVHEETPVIRAEHAAYSIRLTQFLFDNLHFAAENHIASSDHEQNVQKILKMIRQKGTISVSDLTRRTQHLQMRTRKDVIESLKESKYIDEVRRELPDGTFERLYQAL